MIKNKNPKAVYITLIIFLIIIFIFSLVLGAEKINVFNGLYDIFNGNKSVDSRILQFVRLPRTLAGILAGCALGVAGAIIQSVLSNSLASPSTIGVNSGAGLAVAIFGALFPDCVMFVPFCFPGRCFSWCTFSSWNWRKV